MSEEKQSQTSIPEESSLSKDDVLNVKELSTVINPPSLPSTEKEASEQAKEIEQKLRKYYIVEDKDEPTQKEHKFWNTQPVIPSPEKAPKSFQEVSEIESREAKLAILKHEPLPIPSPFEWFDFNDNDSEQMQDLYDLLAENYVEDSDSWFQFSYSQKCIKWAINVPGTPSDWKLGVRTSDKKVMVAFISAVPCRVFVGGKLIDSVIIDFLCVHKSLRSKRLAPLMIKEITRRVNCHGTFTAIYTSGTLLPTPFTTTQYYHRSINVDKLLDVRFTGIPKLMNRERLHKLYRIQSKINTKGWRPFRASDAPEAMEKLNTFLRTNFDVSMQFSSIEEFTHIFTTRPGVVYTFVIENENAKGKKAEKAAKTAPKDKSTSQAQIMQLLEEQQPKGKGKKNKKGKKEEAAKEEKKEAPKPKPKAKAANESKETKKEKEEDAPVASSSTQPSSSLSPSSASSSSSSSSSATPSSSQPESTSDNIKAFISFYVVQSSVHGSTKYSHITTGYLYYYFVPQKDYDDAVRASSSLSAVETFASVAPPILTEMVENVLVEGKKIGIDVMNCLDIMMNPMFLKDLKFGPGDGRLNYYVYNLAVPQIKTDKLAVVLV
ncbi:putative Protein NMT-1 [Monocercomonoides exilis]|uniref:putative Protein NMT-1 n=1 Tax=Monocercomonoides exilis TaxID=2049356 RepID=UPI003559BE0B|nr:putative Protein NMT-1 [Monocercomonoides exilis]|eukprot:MONOS_3594.1-p1 / transcript=MONOS_3594.1 / gene=MONOS_3594 / organism=Monocercomonoides_exilis_PA203 / gene_product=Protein NMT-1, isoform c / transcript_product=Protein NMT-1, isoform c / location=Mono_scaffold00086:20549-22649(-) / protein_length=603 / sequence_SO=supercontig / SO=protein_coding / is_pseudo=false